MAKSRPFSRLSKVTYDALRSELHRRSNLARALTRERKRLAARIDALDRQIRESGVTMGGRTGATRERPRNKTTLVEALAATLKGKTMSVAHAMEAVRDAGYKTASNSFRVQVNTALIKGPFKRVGRGQYTAK